MPAFINLAGISFGRWSVICRSYNNGKQTYWDCRCSCGTEKRVSGQALRSGNSNSCGCLHKEVVRGNRIHSEDMALTTLICRMEKSANHRGYSWELSSTDVAMLFNQRCYYCGCSPDQRIKVRKMINRKNTYRTVSDFTYNGLDRVDNTKGYSSDNCVPCCGTCNRMKGSMSQSDFIAHIKQIVGGGRLCL